MRRANPFWLAAAAVCVAPLARAVVSEGWGVPAPPIEILGEEALAPAAARDLSTLAGWRARVDAASGRAQRIYGPAIEVPATDTSGVPSDGDLTRFGEDFLARHAALLGTEPAELVPRVPVRSGRFSFLVYDQTSAGVPVEDARLTLVFADGALVTARADLARDLGRVAAAPSLPRARAIALAERAVRDGGAVPRAPASVDEARPLAIVRDGDRFRLAWRVRLDADPPARLTVLIDAEDGRMLGTRDAIRHLTGVDVRGDFEPRRVGDPRASSGFGFIFVAAEGQTVTADSRGHAVVMTPPGAATAWARFDGSFIAEQLFGTSSVTSAGVAVVAGTSETIAWSDANSTLAERDLYHSRLVVHARHKAMAPDIAWVNTPLRYELEILDPQGCNAYWDSTAGQVNLYAESGTCNDVARVADVVYHETTHGLHQALSSGGFIAADVAEGSADYVAASINDDPEIGPTFFKATSKGIRNFKPDKVYPADSTGEPHNDGQIWGGAFWDLRAALIAEEGYAAGVARADRLLADTLRADPTLTDGYWDVLLADDDDGNVANGTPHLCEIVSAFAAHGLGPSDGLRVFHVPLGARAPGPGVYSVRAHIAPWFPQCYADAFRDATLEWRLAGNGGWTAVPMHDDLVPGWRDAEIPAQAEGSVVEYRLRADDASGRTFTAPAANAATQPFSFPVLTVRSLFRDDFETDRGWTHRQIFPATPIAGGDDWERGTPRGRASDPSAAFSGDSVWGNDLGIAGDGSYPDGVENRLESPVVDCERASGVHLRFRRWLNVRKAPGTEAMVLVNGHAVWMNPAGEDTRDHEWRFEDLDVSKYADGRKIRVAFGLKTGSGQNLGGWNVDDVEVVATGTREPPASCDVGAGGGGPVAVFGLALSAAGVLRRRRAARDVR